MDAKERINYTKEGDHYVGFLANLPQVVSQAKSLPELEARLFKLGKRMLEILSQCLDNGFELKEFSLDEFIGREEGKDKVQNEWVKEHGQQTQ